MDKKEFVTCRQCILANAYKLPAEVLRKRIQDYRYEYNRPMANRLRAVLNGEDSLIQRLCSLHKRAFASSLCASLGEFREN